MAMGENASSREPTDSGSLITWLLLAVGIAVAVVVAWALWPRPAATASPARQYLNVSACLLTGPSGIVAGTTGAPVWDAMESASLATHVMVSYLPDTSPADAVPMLNALIERKCGLIVAAGVPAGQVIAAADANPHEQFMLVAAMSHSATPPNAVVVSPGSAAAPIDQAIHALAAQA
jgi:hypothetical protein